jgi:hypothetical protein
MLFILYSCLLLAGIVLVITGAYYHVNRKKLASDPLLITTCYAWGSLNIAACIPL